MKRDVLTINGKKDGDIELPNVLDVIPQINYGSVDDLAG